MGLSDKQVEFIAGNKIVLVVILSRNLNYP